MLRGLAALAVVIAHTTSFGLYQQPIWDWLKWTPLRLLWSGHQAVILFFALSGFALTRMLEGSEKPMSYSTFIFVRIIRLYPPYIASVVIALLIYRGVHMAGFQWTAGWMNTVNPTMDTALLLRHALMLGNFNTGVINPPIWSIVHEMRLSLIFPLLFILVRRYALWAIAILACCSIAIAGLQISGFFFAAEDLRLHPLLTLHYALFFSLGIFVARNAESLQQRAKSLPLNQRSFGWVIGLILYAYPFDNPWSQGERMLGDIIIGIGSVIIIILSLALNDSPIRAIGIRLGRISYSLYLNHYVIIAASAILLYSQFGSIAVWLAALPCSIALAHIFYAGIERPAINLARRWRIKKNIRRMRTV